MPISLSDDQLSTVMRLAMPLPPQDRDAYLHRVASLLRDIPEIGDGAVSRAARRAQSELFQPPTLNGYAGTPQHGRKLIQRRAPPAA